MKLIYQKRLFLLCLIGGVFFLSCHPYYINSQFEERTADHQTVAVLPFEMVYTGIKPEKLTEEDLLEIELAESKAFQISFFNEILRSTKYERHPIRIELQDYRKTINLLEEAGIELTSLPKQDPTVLAEILGVDAIVRARVEKNRLMTDLESFGIELGIHILDVIAPHSMWPWLPFGITRSKKVNASYSLFDKTDGTTLWSIAFDIDADWRRPANEIINDINRRASKKFPYRTK